MGASAARLTVVNARSEFERAAVWLEDFCSQASVPGSVTSRLQVAMDEVLSNVVNHALVGVPEGQRQIWLDVRVQDGKLELEVTDDGPPFDPTGYKSAPQAGRVAERREGGVGLVFVRSLVDEIRFFRDGDRNHLVLCKRVGPTS